MTAYYNEIDPYAAEWLRNLITSGHIAPGIVDERSIEDVRPDDLLGFTQCHFFAGIGVWSYALRLAGWSDQRQVWTGSCPCQPFSSAGKGIGLDDERHLWPAFYQLIAQCEPPVVFGEQVASKNADPWIDLVQADMEALGYAFGCVPFPSAGVGAPHIRDRLYWVADADTLRWEEVFGQSDDGMDHGSNDKRAFVGFGSKCQTNRVVNSNNEGLEGRGAMRQCADQRLVGSGSVAGGVANPNLPIEHQRAPSREQPLRELGATRGYWGDADWLYCRDGTLRPVEPGTFPLAHEAPARMGRLRAYGNAINAEAARVFIEAFDLT